MVVHNKHDQASQVNELAVVHDPGNRVNENETGEELVGSNKRSGLTHINSL